MNYDPVTFVFEPRRPWRRLPEAGLVVGGWPLHRDRPLDMAEAARRMADRDPASLMAFAQELQGFFALVRYDGRDVTAITDPVRSTPIFYLTEEDGSIRVGNDAYRLVGASEDERDPDSEIEFSYLGFVSGSRTLHPRLRQVESGSVFQAMSDASAGSGRPILRQDTYSTYKYPSHVAGADGIRAWARAFDGVLERVFTRLVAIADGRTIVVPLSGGYDSRLLATWLRKLGYPNLLAFTYGRPGNREAQVSRQVADQLQIPWRFIEYSNPKWHEWFHSAERHAFYRFSDGLASLPHMQDWPAVWELKRQGHVPEDAIFVPGHSADLLAGSRSASLPFLYGPEPPERNEVIEGIRLYYYSLRPGPAKGTPDEVLITRRIEQALGDISGFENGASCLENWDIRERQAKFIVNSVRNYEFWGYDWWLPFWDPEFVAFWASVPLDLKIGASFYNGEVERIYQETAGGAIDDRGSAADLLPRIKVLTQRTVLSRPLRWAYNLLRKSSEYEKHPLAWYGMIPEAKFKEIFSGREKVNALLARERLGWVEF